MLFTTIDLYLKRAGRHTTTVVILAAVAWATTLATTAGPLASSPASALVGGPGAGGSSGGGQGATTIERSASRATSTTRAVAGSVIGIGMCIAGLILAFKRDFNWAAAAIGCGLVAFFLASSAGVDSLKNLVDHVAHG